jgi:heat shock protein HslJ
MIQKTFSIIVLAAALSGLSGLGPKPAIAAESAPLSGDWTLESFGEAINPTEVLPETTVTATFADGILNGSAGCNQYRSQYQTRHRRVTISPATTTRKSCPPAIIEQEQAFLNALLTTRTYRLNDQGQLLIRYKTEAGPQVLTFNPAPVALPLENTAWTVVAWSDQPDFPIANTTLTLRFADAGNAGGSSGCNSFGANYTTTGNTLTVKVGVSTLRVCLVAIDQQEKAYFAALGAVNSYQINRQGQLEIFYTDGVETKTITFDPQ